MPKVRHFQCAKCPARVTSPNGKGFPTEWTEIRVTESLGGGTIAIHGPISRRMWSTAAKVLLCGRCWPRDWRYAGRRLIEQGILSAFSAAKGTA